MTRKLVAVGYITLALTASAIPLPLPHPQPLLDGLLGHGRHPSSSSNKALDIIDLPLLRGIKPSRIIKKDLLGPLDDALSPILSPIPVTDITSDTLKPVTGPLESITGPLDSVLGVDLDLLTPTDLLCAKVDGEFIGKAYALGCVCLGQDGLLLTAEAGVEVVDGLVDWVTAQVNARGFHSEYPEYSIPTCEQRTDDDEDDFFRCPVGQERKPGGKCAAILLASPRPSSSAPSAPTVNPTSAPVPSSSAGPTGIAVNSVAPSPSPSASSASASSPSSAGPAPSSAVPPAPSTSNAPVNIASTPTDDGEDAPYCDEQDDVQAQDADGELDDGEGEWVQVQSVTSTETVIIPATAYIQQATVTETTTSTSTMTITSTSTSTSTLTSTVTQTKTETVHDCEQSFAAAAVPPAPAPSRTPSSSAAIMSSSAIGVASVAAAPSSAPTPAPSPAPVSSAPSPVSSEDGGVRPSGVRLNAHPRPHSSSSAAPPCPSGEVMGATRCCPVDMIERDGDCGCNDGYKFLINACVEVCLPPLQLIDGKCIELDLGVATDVVDGLGLDGLTEGLGLGNGLAGLL